MFFYRHKIVEKTDYERVEKLRLAFRYKKNAFAAILGVEPKTYSFYYSTQEVPAERVVAAANAIKEKINDNARKQLALVDEIVFGKKNDNINNE